MLDAADSRAWTILEKATDEFVGLVSLAPHHDGSDVEVSYQLLPRFWGRGLAVEAVAAAIGYDSAVMGLRRIVAETRASNHRSRRMIERLGMTEFATAHRFGERQIVYAHASHLGRE